MNDWREQVDAELNAPPTAIGARSYPRWVIALGAAVVLAFCYSLLSLPHHIALARQLANANRRDAARDYAGAETEYAALLADIPASHAARIGLAHALFADAIPDNDARGIALLAGMRLERSDWERLSPVMPEAYRGQFVEDER